MNTMATTTPPLIDRYFTLGYAYQTLIWFVLILVIKHDTLFTPPIWDAASGIFPAAIYLSENSFDILSLIQKDDWWLGGPNVHAFSLWTWVVAIVMSTTKSPMATYLALHLLTFGLTALALSSFLRCIDHYGVDRTFSLVTGALVISTPLILVQIGFIYTEIPVMCFSIFAYSAWLKEKEGLAIIFALTALSIKLTGVVIALSIGLVLSVRFFNKPSIRRAWQALFMITFFVILMSAYSLLGGAEQTHGLSWGKDQKMFESLWERVSSIPDVAAMLFIGSISSLIIVFFSKRMNIRSRDKQVVSQYGLFGGVEVISASFLLVFCGSVAYGTHQGYLFLPRYIIPMIPFAMVSILLIIKALNWEVPLRMVFLVFCYLNIENHNGDLYQSAKSFGLTERTHHYKAYSQGHNSLIEGISKLPDDVPIYVSRGIGYLVSHPMIGRLEQPKPNIIRNYLPEHISKQVCDFPDEFYFVVSTRSRVHGGKHMRRMLNKMKKNPNYQVVEILFVRNAVINMGIYHVFNFSIEP